MIQLHPTAQFLPEGGKVAAARIVLRGSETVPDGDTSVGGGQV